MSIARRLWCVMRLTSAAALALSLGALAEAQEYKQTDLVSDLAGAMFQDPNLVNPWGLSRGSTTPWWAADNGMGVASLYNGNTGMPQSLVVTIPPAPGGTMGVPSGTVFNGTTDFKLPNGNPARFLFVTEDGVIAGWNGGTMAVVAAKDPNAVYKGVAIASHYGANFLYVANFRKGRIDVFDTMFKRVRRGDDGEDAFRDERVPHGFAPFNVQNIGGSLYVTFAKQDDARHDDVPGPGLGFVDVFSSGGRLLHRLQHGPWLNSPWGLALAPNDFGAFSHDLLVGQFGSGEVAVYSVSSGRFLGRMMNDSGGVLSIDGLWALSFGNGAAAGPVNTLFFTAGLQGESHGLFGTLTSVAAAPFGNGQ